MQEVKVSPKGIKYVHKVLLDKPKTITRVGFWGIPRSENTEVTLKIGRYKKPSLMSFEDESLESLVPKSELTLTAEEFHALIDFLKETYEPFRQGAKKFISIDETFNDRHLECLEEIFSHGNQQEIVDFLVDHNVVPEEFVIALKQTDKIRAVSQYQDMLNDSLNEHEWQRWFEKNSWVLGTEFVKILDERRIDSANISDFLMKAYDGFVDIVEIKRPQGSSQFWHDKLDHDNYVPHNDLVKAITQCSNYIYEIERESNSIKFLERADNTPLVKPRCILIFGRSNDWNKKQMQAYRILCSAYHNITILTYDHVLARAQRLIE
ncbi:DUF4263 domain-containing protein [Mucilaginibacter limnophilus]|uniref:DUF4263 domain-containing protein n=1 Tax=Mucilaginibacter limnophilus TaxID=1932778 RepID=A0A3S2V8K0_9SPHI|nr:Shedu anti-phage system protein SduA domain-containing protein [Mucilaginibacter limnophilus]RVU01268.1 DUF4263 domain-containing protein [Mucilaginibacter limnophilus]